MIIWTSLWFNANFKQSLRLDKTKTRNLFSIILMIFWSSIDYLSRYHLHEILSNFYIVGKSQWKLHILAQNDGFLSSVGRLRDLIWLVINLTKLLSYDWTNRNKRDRFIASQKRVWPKWIENREFRQDELNSRLNHIFI